MFQKYKLSTQYPLKRIFIAGAGNNLGMALCMELAAEGWTIGVSDTNTTSVEKCCAMISAAGGRALSCAGNISEVKDYEDIAKNFISTTEGIDLLINNTGVDEESIFGDYSVENWQELVSRHQMSVIYGSHFFLPYMIQKKSGYVINITSAANSNKPVTMAPYNMAKGAVISISETIRTKFKNENIGVTVALLCYFNSKASQNNFLAEVVSGIDMKQIAERILHTAGDKKFCFVSPQPTGLKFWFRQFFTGISS